MTNRKIIMAWVSFGLLFLIVTLSYSSFLKSFYRSLKFEYYKSDCLSEKNTSSCDKLLQLSQDKKLNLKYDEFSSLLYTLCKTEDFEVCVMAAKRLFKKKQFEPMGVEMLEFACRDGSGGNMEACGIYASFLEKEGKLEDAKRLKGDACNVGVVRFCE